MGGRGGSNGAGCQPSLNHNAARNGEEEMFLNASSMINMATFSVQSELSPVQPLNSTYNRTEQLTPQQSKEADVLQWKPFTP